jgi:hypothetical protein
MDMTVPPGRSAARCGAWMWALVGFASGALACARVTPSSASGHGGAGGTSGGQGGSGGTRVIDAGGYDLPVAPPPLTDFPPDPILGTPTTSANAPDLFGQTARTSGAPCLGSPATGTLMPRNWLRPRFEYRPSADENLFEIRLEVARFATPLRIYTTDRTYALAKDLWDKLRLSVNDEAITVSVRALTLSSTGTVQTPPSPAAQATFTIAPVDAPGKIVYWALPSADTTMSGILSGFGIGEESVETVLTGPQVNPPMRGTQDNCIGCHAATPDGLGVGFVFGPPSSMIGLDTYFDSVADIQTQTLGGMPAGVMGSAVTTIRALRGIPAFSLAHWSDGDRIVLLSDAQEQGDLRWVDLSTGDQGTLARTGDANGAVEPTFSHDGNTIVYVSTPRSSIHDGRLNTAPADLFVVPYGARAGGTAMALPGASDPNTIEWYPALSPDDRYVAYTAASAPMGTTPTAYANYASELFVIPVTGGQPMRLAANDAPACLGQKSPGIMNDWSKWSPQAATALNGKTYYWLVFSSKRSGSAQLYITAITQNGELGGLSTYPALYLWNQPSAQSNHTPSWDNYVIPPVP